MYVFLSILVLLAAILLVLIVLIQNSKGGGLASGFSSSNQIMGVRKTTDFLEKATWSLAAFVVVLSIVCAGIAPTGKHINVNEPNVNPYQQEVMVDPNLNLPNLSNVPAGDAGESAPVQE